MTGPRIDQAPSVPALPSLSQWESLQYATGGSAATAIADPAHAKTKVPATSRLPTLDEFNRMQSMTGAGVKALTIPALPQFTPPIAPRDVTRTPHDPQTAGLSQTEWARRSHGAAGVVDNFAAPILDHPWMSAGAVAASLVPVIGPYVTAAMAGDIVSNVALYGYQKHLEQQATPGARKIMEADPERITGEAAIAQGIMLGMISYHTGRGVVAKSLAADAAIAPIELHGVHPAPIIPDVPRAPWVRGDVTDMELPVGTNKFIGDLQSGTVDARSYAKAGNQPARPAGFEATANTSRAGVGAKPVEGFVAPETATAGKVTPLETLPANATLEQTARWNEARRTYEAQRLEQDTADLSAERQAAADKITAADALRPRRRAAAIVQTPVGAEVLGTAAAQHGLPADASPFLPNTPQDAAWTAGHESVTSGAPPEGLQPSEPLPSYPDGFSMGGALRDNRIPAASELPQVARGTSPLAPPNPATPAGAPDATSPLAPVEGTGTLQTRGLSAGIDAKAIEQKLTSSLGDLPQYRQLSMADQAARASDLLTNNPVLARQIAMGDVHPPEGILPEAVMVAVENKAIADGDVSTLYDLAHGKLTGEATTMGQRIRTLGERDPESPVSAIEEANTRRSSGKNVEALTAQEVRAIEHARSAVQVSARAWKLFLDSLTC